MNFEINGNLTDIPNYNNFKTNILTVYSIFYEHFGKEIMGKIELYIDNATENSGYTPIITPILKKHLIIKLGISNFSNSEQIVYQFSHELCHYVFYSILGLKKEFADKEEENICSAMSLVIMKRIFPNKLNFWKSHISGLTNENYSGGLSIAESVNYDIEKLKTKIIKLCENKKGVKV